MQRLPALLAALGSVGIGFALLSFLVSLLSGLPDWTDFGWSLANLGIGLILLISAGVMNMDALRERMGTGEARRVGRYGTSAIASTLLGIAILGMLGFLATRYTHRFDWSEAGIHTLSDQTQKVLAGLGEDVHALVLVEPFEEPPLRELLDRYAYASERLRVEFADPNERPGLLEQYAIAPDQLSPQGLLRLELGGESTLVDEIDENRVTNALVKLTRTGAKVVYFLQGHGERPLEGEGGQGREGFARAAAALRNENYRVEPLFLAQEADVPADADALVVAGGNRPLYEGEAEALDRYLGRGGAVLALVDPRVSEGLVGRVAAWGVELGDDIIVDRALALFGRALSPFAGSYDGEHPITRDLRDPRSDSVIFNEVRSVGGGAAGDFAELVYTGEASWAERDVARLDSTQEAAFEDEDRAGPVPVMVAGTPRLSGDSAASEEAAEPRLVVVGDTHFASNELIDSGRNRDLFVNAVNWLMGDVEAIAIRPNTSRASRFQLSLDQFRTIRSLSLFVLPEAIAVLGVFTWWTRRHPAR